MFVLMSKSQGQRNAGEGGGRFEEVPLEDLYLITHFIFRLPGLG